LGAHGVTGASLSLSSGPTENSLTREEKAEAKKLYREAKAKRLNLSASEINLTSEEVKAAFSSFRKSGPLALKTTLVETPLPGSPPIKKQEEKVSPKPVAKATSRKDPTLVAKDKAISDLRSFRKIVDRVNPINMKSPKYLHLCGYLNYRHRLGKKWASYSNQFKTSNSSENPLIDEFHPEGLGDHWEKILKTIEDSGVVKDSEDPELYLLSDSKGNSWWDGGEPNSTCPESLTNKIPRWFLEEWEQMAKGEDLAICPLLDE
jgi:hypothetical protein